MRSLVNLLFYQAGWFACVMGAAHGMPWLGVAVAMAVLAFHLASAAQPRQEMRLILAAILTGAVLETLLVQSGWVSYAGGSLFEGTAPLWIVALWAIFATTFNVSLRALRGRPWIAAALGAVGAPLAYAAGAKLGAVQLDDVRWALGAIALAWAVATPLLFSAAKRYDGFAPA